MGAEPNPNKPDEDHVDPDIVRADLKELDSAVSGVTRVANRSLAHRTRVKVADVTYDEIDRAFDAIEATLQKYYLLIVGSTLVSAEPTAQFEHARCITFHDLSTAMSLSDGPPPEVVEVMTAPLEVWRPSHAEGGR